MVEANVGSLLVTEGDKITGIVTERDYLRRVALEGRTDKGTTVREIVSSPLMVTPQTTVDECMALMTERRIRHVPVVDGGECRRRSARPMATLISLPPRDIDDVYATAEEAQAALARIFVRRTRAQGGRSISGY